MSGKEIDKLISGIIVLLLIVAVWKWYQDDMKPSKCRKSIVKGSCGCVKGKCRCSSGDVVDGGGYAGGKLIKPPEFEADDEASYDENLRKMALESAVSDSHKKYVKSLSFSGNPTGASHNTDNDGLGMSYGDGGNFHGLTMRKWCKARQMATPADDARVVPSSVIVKEDCYIGLNELV
jgi:hypothetical protein